MRGAGESGPAGGRKQGGGTGGVWPPKTIPALTAPGIHCPVEIRPNPQENWRFSRLSGQISLQ